MDRVLVTAGAIGDRAGIDRLVHTDRVGDARLCNDVQRARHDDLVGEVEEILRGVRHRPSMSAHPSGNVSTNGAQMGRVGATAVPPIQYAQSVGARIAYQVIGDGPVTMVGIPPFAQNIEIMWERPEFARMFARMATFARVVHFDKRGTGMSDRTPMPTLDERVDDTRAVMDAAGVERAVLYGVSEGGPLAILFARTYPERVSSLILHGTSARFVGDETPAERDQRRAWFALFAQVWGTDDSFTLRLLAPSVTDPSYVAWEPRYERQSATPPDLAELFALTEDIDVTALLPHITVPTLVIHRTGDFFVPVERGRELAAAIPNARLAEVEGIDHLAHIGDTDSWLDIVEEFVTGTPVMRHGAPATPAVGHRDPDVRRLHRGAGRRAGSDERMGIAARPPALQAPCRRGRRRCRA